MKTTTPIPQSDKRCYQQRFTIRFKPFFGMVILAAILLAQAGASASLLGYYPMDSNSLDASTNGQDLTLVGTGVSNGIPAMFGIGAYQGPPGATTQRAERLDTTTPNLYDQTFTNFSASIWVKPDTWSDTRDRYIMGKFDNTSAATSPIEKWNIRKAGGTSEPGAIIVLMTAGGQINLDVAGTPHPDADTNVFHHVMFTYQQTEVDDFATNATVKLFFDGTLEVIYTTFPTPYLSGANTKAFQIGNEGDSRSANAQRSWVGSLDDAAVWNETISDGEVALIYGLGRLAGVSLRAMNAGNTDTQIHDVLAAYNNQTNAVAGGYFWNYNAGTGNPIVGTISGSVTNRDAFIVLGQDGSGMMSGIPIPTIAALASGNTLDLSWLESGWRLQVQTNAPGNGISTNWIIVPDSESTNHVITTISPANGSVFYRLVLP
jgi:hypothetical protein